MPIQPQQFRPHKAKICVSWYHNPNQIIYFELLYRVFCAITAKFEHIELGKNIKGKIKLVVSSSSNSHNNLDCVVTVAVTLKL